MRGDRSSGERGTGRRTFSENGPGRGRTAIRVLHWLRDAWLIAGITLALFLVLELAYRAQAELRSRLRGQDESTRTYAREHPYSGQAWWERWLTDLEALRSRYDPYRGWWLEPAATPYLNVDSAGLRRTVHPPGGAVRSRRLFLLGGSAMWGYYAPDSLTIPSLVAAGLHARRLDDVEVVNLARPGLNLTQEAITLLLELRRGSIPDVAVFFGGFNDVAAAGRERQAGHVIGGSADARRWKLGGRGFWGELLGLGRHSRLVQHLAWKWEAIRGGDRAPPDPEALCRDVALYYRNMARGVEALGGEFGFTTFFVWQPLLATTRKPLTPFERSLGDQPWPPVAGWPETREMFRLCTAAVDSAMEGGALQGYVPLHALFDQDSGSTFLDDLAHFTERGNARLADRIVELVAPVLEASRSEPGPATGGTPIAR